MTLRLAGVAAAFAVVGASVIPHSGANAQASAAVPPDSGSAADVQFVQGMIHHHAQALVMTALVPTRTRSEAMRLLAERITVSQRDEIGLMQRWLRQHGQTVTQAPVTLEAFDASHHHMMMPGMLTSAELHQLADTSGPDFDRLFLRGMIQHHGGALTMVADLFATPGGAQDSWIYQFASDIDADQRAEIRRMRAMLPAPADVPTHP